MRSIIVKFENLHLGSNGVCACNCTISYELFPNRCMLKHFIQSQNVILLLLSVKALLDEYVKPSYVRFHPKLFVYGLRC